MATRKLRLVANDNDVLPEGREFEMDAPVSEIDEFVAAHASAARAASRLESAKSSLKRRALLAKDSLDSSDRSVFCKRLVARGSLGSVKLNFTDQYGDIDISHASDVEAAVGEAAYRELFEETAEVKVRDVDALMAVFKKAKVDPGTVLDVVPVLRFKKEDGMARRQAASRSMEPEQLRALRSIVEQVQYGPIATQLAGDRKDG